MNCDDWRARIAADDAAAGEHLIGCEECREFARELAANAAALRSVDAGEAAYAAVRARAMGRVTENTRWSRRLGFAAGIAAAALLVFAIRAREPLRVVEMRIPPPYHIPAPDLKTPRRPAQIAKGHIVRPPRRRAVLAAKTERDRPLTAIKLLTDDPNVVIIWLLDEKGGSE